MQITNFSSFHRFLLLHIPYLCFVVFAVPLEQVPAPVIQQFAEAQAALLTNERHYEVNTSATASSSSSVAASAPSSSSASSVLNAVPGSPYALSYSPSAIQASLTSSLSEGGGRTTAISSLMTTVDKAHPRSQTDIHGENEDQPGHKRLRMSENGSNEGPCRMDESVSIPAIQHVDQFSDHMAKEDNNDNNDTKTVVMSIATDGINNASV